MEDKKILKNAIDYVNKLLLPLENHYYHHFEHALDVMNRANYIAKKEGVAEEDILILSLACVFHDTGFIIQYDDNEEIGAKIAENYLKSVLFPKEKIEAVKDLILATRISYKNPKNILEAIIKDSDLDNLGREDFFDKGDKLKKELETIKDIKIKNPQWHHSSLDLLYEYKFNTKTQKEEREKTKEENIKKLKYIIDYIDQKKPLSGLKKSN